MDKKFWKTREGAELARLVFGKLLSGRTLDDMTLGEHEGRLDLRGITAPTTAVLQQMAEAGEVPAVRVGAPWLQDITLDGLDFSGADLTGICFYDAIVRDCRFDNARFDNLRLWRTIVQDSSFSGAKLAACYLGPWYEGKGTEYDRVDFSKADLHGIACPAATFRDVDFSSAKLANIDFGASSFERCTFAGKIHSIIFWAAPPNSDKPTPNPMEDIDFSGAELHFVEFRGLRLDRVTLPASKQHVVVHNYRCVLERGIERFKGVNAVGTLFAHELYWSNPLRDVGIWHRDTLGETEDEREATSAVLRELDEECAGDST